MYIQELPKNYKDNSECRLIELSSFVWRYHIQQHIRINEQKFVGPKKKQVLLSVGTFTLLKGIRDSAALPESVLRVLKASFSSELFFIFLNKFVPAAVIFTFICCNFTPCQCEPLRVVWYHVLLKLWVYFFGKTAAILVGLGPVDDERVLDGSSGKLKYVLFDPHLTCDTLQLAAFLLKLSMRLYYYYEVRVLGLVVRRNPYMYPTSIIPSLETSPSCPISSRMF